MTSVRLSGLTRRFANWWRGVKDCTPRLGVVSYSSNVEKEHRIVGSVATQVISGL